MNIDLSQVVKLLSAVLILLHNPQLTSNPQLQIQANAASIAAFDLAITVLNQTPTDNLSVNTTTPAIGGPVDVVVPPSQSVDISIAPTPIVNTPAPKNSLSFDSVIKNFIVNQGKGVAYFNLYFLDEKKLGASVTIIINGQTLIDPQYGVDGKGADLKAINLVPQSSYDYSVHIEGDTWLSDATGTITIQ